MKLLDFSVYVVAKWFELSWMAHARNRALDPLLKRHNQFSHLLIIDVDVQYIAEDVIKLLGHLERSSSAVMVVLLHFKMFRMSSVRVLGVITTLGLFVIRMVEQRSLMLVILLFDVKIVGDGCPFFL